MQTPGEHEVDRRDMLVGAAAFAGVAAAPSSAHAQAVAADAQAAIFDHPPVAKVSFTVNGQPRALEIDTRTTLLDALREHLHLTGTKKGCDQANVAPAR